MTKNVASYNNLALFRTGFLQATQAIKIKFEINIRSSSKIKFKNKYCELEISKTKCK